MKDKSTVTYNWLKSKKFVLSNFIINIFLAYLINFVDQQCILKLISFEIKHTIIFLEKKIGSWPFLVFVFSTFNLSLILYYKSNKHRGYQVIVQSIFKLSKQVFKNL